MNTPTTNSDNLPPPSPQSPMVVLMLSEPIDPNSKDPLVWKIGGAHPVAPTGIIVRMFFDQDGVDIFSTAPAVGKEGGMMDYVPMKRVLIISRAATLDVFARELEAAEYGDEDEDDEDEGEPEESAHAVPSPAPTNGQTAS
jgi:hypothetical protein